MSFKFCVGQVLFGVLISWLVGRSIIQEYPPFLRGKDVIVNGKKQKVVPRKKYISSQAYFALFISFFILWPLMIWAIVRHRFFEVGGCLLFPLSLIGPFLHLWFQAHKEKL